MSGFHSPYRVPYHSGFRSPYSGSSAAPDPILALFQANGWTGHYSDSLVADSMFQNADGTVLASAENDVVGYRKDLSGNGLHATQADAAKKAKIGPNGGVIYDGMDDIHNVNVAATTNEVLLACVANTPGVSEITYVFAESTSSRLQVWVDGSGFWSATGATASATRSINSATSAASKAVITVTLKSGIIELRINGVSAGTGTLAGDVVTTTLGFGIGGPTWTVAAMWGGNIDAAVGVYSGGFVTADIETIEQTLADRHGVTLP